MSVLEMIPTMADDALGNLRANAERLEHSGSKAQRAQAADLLPAIKTELAARQETKLQRTAQVRREGAELRASRRKAKTAAADE